MLNHSPRLSYRQRKQLQSALAAWLEGDAWEFFATFNFNRETTMAAARKAIKNWLRLVDQAFLGALWSKKPSLERTQGVFMFEHPSSNLHAHAVLVLPPRSLAMKTTVNDIDRLYVMTDSWNRIVPSGQFHSGIDRPSGAAAGYATKDQFQAELYEAFILASEFHTHTGR